jgi:hypothetical protein
VTRVYAFWGNPPPWLICSQFAMLEEGTGLYPDVRERHRRPP